MIMRFDFERNLSVGVECENAGVIDECRYEGQIFEVGCGRIGGTHQMSFDEAVDGRTGTELL